MTGAAATRKLRCSRLGALLVLPASIVSCRGERNGALETNIRADSAGVEIVTNRVAAWGEGARRIDPEPLLSVGSETEGPYQFARVTAGLLLDDGGFVVVESSAAELRFLDADGVPGRPDSETR